MTYEQPALFPTGESLPPDGPAGISPWRDFVRAWTEHVRDCSGRSFASHPTFGPGGSSGRTFPVSCRPCAPVVPRTAPATGRAGSSATTSPTGSPTDGVPAPAAAWPPTVVPWASSSGRWADSGMGSPTGCWTLSTSASPSGGSGSSLLDVLETGPHLLRYCLSPKACAGILRRASRRGRELPASLRSALEAVAG